MTTELALPLPESVAEIAEVIGRDQALNLIGSLPQSGSRAWRKCVCVPKCLPTVGQPLVHVLEWPWLGSSRIGIVGTAPDADAAKFPLNKPVLVADSRRKAVGLDTTGDSKGTLPAALDGIFDQIGAVVVVVRVDEGADEAATLANMIGGVNARTGDFEGVHALVGAESVVGFSPLILIAPGFTHQRPTNNAIPVVAEL